MPKLPAEYAHPITDTLNYEMVLVKAGTFIMGSEAEEASSWEKPEHLVAITKDLYIGKYPVTQAIWKAVMNGHNPSAFKGDRRPVEQVSWQDIVEGVQDESVPGGFLPRLHQNFLIKESSLQNFEFRLPTEAEWEYAAKGGHKGPPFDLDNPLSASSLYCKYAGGDKLKKVGWYSKNSHSETKEVGLLEPNSLGIHDMSGNVDEWCQDWYDGNFYQKCKENGLAKDPLNNQKGRLRVCRGGAWSYGARYCHVALRDGWPPAYRGYRLGFRLVLAPRISGAEKQKRTE